VSFLIPKLRTAMPTPSSRSTSWFPHLKQDAMFSEA
jgi:hypothetical protein